MEICIYQLNFRSIKNYLYDKHFLMTHLFDFALYKNFKYDKIAKSCDYSGHYSLNCAIWHTLLFF